MRIKKFQTGESAYLEKIAAKTRTMEIANQLYIAQRKIDITKGQIAKLIYVQKGFTIPDNEYLHSAQIVKDTLNTNRNPYLKYMKQQIELYNTNIKLEKSKLLPDFQLGYYNQSLQGFQNINNQDVFFNASKRFQYVNAGVLVPLWFKPQQARIESAKIEKNDCCF